MTDPTPSTPRRLLMPDLCVVCFEDDCGCPDGKVTEDMRGQKVPTPATPDEADLLETAWGIIANAGGGDWTTQTYEWASAAARWRSDYFAYLDSRRQGDTVAARVEDVARRLHRERGPSGQAWEDSPKDGWRDRARWLLGIGSDGAGDRG